MAGHGSLADRFGSLRCRLAGAMLLVLVCALALSSVLDQLVAAVARSHGILGILQREPYQDGLVLASFGLAVAALIWLVSAWSLAPLSRASHEAGRIGPAHPGARISAELLPTEMRPLVGAVNGALDRLEMAYEAERQFTADAAHELRTPLAVLGLRLQRARAQQGHAAPDWPAIDQDVRHMTRLVAQLLDLARKQAVGAGPGRDRHVLNLARVAREAAGVVLPIAEAAGRTLALDLPESMPVLGRTDDLRDMLCNLLENAVVHGRGTVTLTGYAGAMHTLQVGDEGDGVPEALRAVMFERFRKAVAASPGTGLGLSIVREVARSHGGHAAFTPGSGNVIEVGIPSSDDVDAGQASASRA